jgi:hypothetical protein
MVEDKKKPSAFPIEEIIHVLDRGVELLYEKCSNTNGMKMQDRGCTSLEIQVELLADYIASLAQCRIVEKQLRKAMGERGISRLSQMADVLLEVSGAMEIESSPEEGEDKGNNRR